MGKKKCKKPKRFYLLVFNFTFFLFTFVFPSFALDLATVKTCFLNGDYQQAISEGERLLAGAGHSEKGLDELYYILGLSYLKEEKFLRASDIFEIILIEFKGSPWKEEAEFGLADTYFLRGNYQTAYERYQKLLHSSPRGRLVASLYERLSSCASRLGNIGQARDFLEKAKQIAPRNQGPGLDFDNSSSGEGFYTVQTGSFVKPANANSLLEKLTAKGYPAFLETSAGATPEKVFRVKVGRFKTLKEAEALEEKLAQEGYPTRICP
jgi:tetratricopeptide (TPR) repeat protein